MRYNKAIKDQNLLSSSIPFKINIWKWLPSILCTTCEVSQSLDMKIRVILFYILLFYDFRYPRFSWQIMIGTMNWFSLEHIYSIAVLYNWSQFMSWVDFSKENNRVRSLAILNLLHCYWFLNSPSSKFHLLHEISPSTNTFHGKLWLLTKGEFVIPLLNINRIEQNPALLVWIYTCFYQKTLNESGGTCFTHLLFLPLIKS